MKEAVRNRARELGFDDCRITSASPPVSAPRYESWLAAGCQGEMAYLERNAHKRLEPRLILPGARSIITLATSYFADPSEPLERRSNKPLESKLHQASGPPSATVSDPVGAPRGLIALYARYRDYHDVIAPRLEQLARFVDALGGADARSLWYQDTGPILERDLAQRAGLGFIGKHTNLISRGLGNWFFISEILTTLEIEPDDPERNRCGSCARCLAACPTGAITAPFHLDARLCISYLTIELKGPIPLPLRRALGNRIFGCDDCLAACPWNRFAREGRIMKEQARPDLSTPDLLDLLALDQEAFRRRFADTPVARVKRRGLLRNVCVALGNLGDPAALPALEKAARQEEPLIADHARWAISEI